MKRCIAIVTGILAACGQAPAPAPAPTSMSIPSQVPAPSRASPTPPERPAGDLFGEWQVASLQSPRLDASAEAPGDPRQVAVLFGVRGIEAASQCMPYLFEHRRIGERIEIIGKPWPEPVCMRMRLPYEEVFGGLVQDVTHANQAASGDVRLSGPAGTVTLSRPEGGTISNPFGDTPAPGSRLLWGHFRVVEVGGVKPSVQEPMDVAVARWWIEARSGCLPFRWKVVRVDANLTLNADWPDGVCERAQSPAEQALERVMPGVRRFDWIAPYRVRLSGPAGSVTLVRVRAGGQPAV